MVVFPTIKYSYPISMPVFTVTRMICFKYDKKKKKDGRSVASEVRYPVHFPWWDIGVLGSSPVDLVYYRAATNTKMYCCTSKMYAWLQLFVSGCWYKESLRRFLNRVCLRLCCCMNHERVMASYETDGTPAMMRITSYVIQKTDHKKNWSCSFPPLYYFIISSYSGFERNVKESAGWGR